LGKFPHSLTSYSLLTAIDKTNLCNRTHVLQTTSSSPSSVRIGEAFQLVLQEGQLKAEARNSSS